MFLREHTQPLTVLPGIGPAAAEAYGRLEIRTVADLVCHYPRDYQDRRVVRKLADAPDGVPTSVLVTVTGQTWIGPPRRKTPRIQVEDESARGVLVCFNRAFLAKALEPGVRCYVWGVFALKGDLYECTAFEHEIYTESPKTFLRLVPVYGATTGLGQPALRRALAGALDRVLPGLEDEVPAAILAPRGLPGTAAAIREIHAPTTPETLAAARKSLVFEELLHLNFSIARRLGEVGVRGAPDGGRPSRRAGHGLRDDLVRRLPFALTDDQHAAMEEICRDLRAPTPMRRLLQGDVGCGKTLVALLAALDVIQAGEQVALMAPTELLARQHAESTARFLEPLGVRVALLVSGVPAPARRRLLGALAEGAVDIVVGTHALFSGDVRFLRLGLAVIDEQQRFGVEQRRELARKGPGADILQMTATPIPRSLALTLFGDLELTEIRGMPAGRKPVMTHLARAANSAKVYERVRRELERGRQAYFVYPVITGGGDGPAGLRDAERMYEHLSRVVYPAFRTALIHSRVPESDKSARMAGFSEGKVSLLVATSVVEVGVDVPNATCMVIEHAERFGLSALHQLRGRVGRGPEQSYVFLVYGDELTPGGVGRLKVMKETSDGFRIAEEDLRLRGPGAVTGVEQAGYARLGIADLAVDGDLLLETRGVVRGLLARDPGLAHPANAPLRAVLERSPRFGEIGV